MSISARSLVCLAGLGLWAACSGVRPAGTGSSGATGSDTAGSTGSTGSGSTGSTGAGSTGSSGTGGHGPPYRVLFDAAHKQVEGNACWTVASPSQADPQPSNPSSATAWSGGISSWGYDLYASGRYAVHQLPSGSALNYGQGGPGDLSGVDVFITDEPEQTFSSSEKQALVRFAQAGGGIFLVSDHSGAVRCSRCTEAVQVINDFLQNEGSAFGAKCDGNDVGGSGLLGSVDASGLGAHVAQGPFGSGSQLAYHSGSTVSLTGANSAAQVVITSSAGGMMVASPLSSGGRLVLVGDSSPEEDGSGTQCPTQPYNGWGEANDRALLLNATAWLAHDGS